MADVMSLRREAIANAPHLESASGSYASFETDIAAPLKECKVGFEPVQDLHGYDHPWPAGGGKNLLPDLEQNASNNGVTSSFDKETGIFTVNGTSTTTALLLTLLSIPPEMLVFDTSEYYTISCTVVSGSMTVPEGTGITCALALFDSSNSSYIRGGTTVTTFENYSGYGRGITSSGNFRLYIQGWREGMVFDNYKIKVQIEKGQVATAWAPYENICPITGFDKVNAIRTGRNLFSTDIVTGAINTRTGVFDNSINNLRVRDKIKVPNGSKLTLSWSETGRNIFSFAYKDDGSFSRYLGLRMYAPAYFTLEDDECYFAFYQYNSTSELTGIQLEIGSAATDYRSYVGEDIDVEFPVLGKNICPIPKLLKNGVTDEPWLYWGSSFTKLVDFLNTLTPGTYTISCKITVATVPDSGITATAPPYIRALVGETYYQVTSYQPVNDNSPYEGKTYYKSASFTITDAIAGNIKYCYFYADDATNHSGSDVNIRGRFDVSEIQIESGGTATEYEPYSNTAYGGYFDPNSGDLVINWKYINLPKTGWMKYQYDGDGYFLYTVGSQFHTTDRLLMKCDTLKSVGTVGNGTVLGEISIASNDSGFLRCRPFLTVAEWENYLVDHSVNICFPIEQITYHLTPHQLKSLRGQNNIWSDANGEVEVKYWTH